MSKSSRRLKKQNIKQRYAKAREEAQLAGVIHTTPEGAVREERVVSLGAAQLPEVIRQSLRENWATPDAAKPAIIANLLEPFFTREVGPDGRPVVPNRRELIELARILKTLDQTQYERDHPELASNGTNVNISLQNTLQATEVMRTALEQADPKAATEHIMRLTEQAFNTTQLSAE